MRSAHVVLSYSVGDCTALKVELPLAHVMEHATSRQPPTLDTSDLDDEEAAKYVKWAFAAYHN